LGRGMAASTDAHTPHITYRMLVYMEDIPRNGNDGPLFENGGMKVERDIDGGIGEGQFSFQHRMGPEWTWQSKNMKFR
jgi:hypothetical protein